jgi:alpha-tubulin suppressor-like RCC1 family protein
LFDGNQSYEAYLLFTELRDYKDSINYIESLKEPFKIITVSAGFQHTVGLKFDGTAIAVGFNGDGQCDVGGWSNIIAVSASTKHTVGLRSDGTVVAVGVNDTGQCDVRNWGDFPH